MEGHPTRSRHQSGCHPHSFDPMVHPWISQWWPVPHQQHYGSQWGSTCLWRHATDVHCASSFSKQKYFTFAPCFSFCIRLLLQSTFQYLSTIIVGSFPPSFFLFSSIILASSCIFKNPVCIRTCRQTFSLWSWILSFSALVSNSKFYFWMISSDPFHDIWDSRELSNSCSFLIFSSSRISRCSCSSKHQQILFKFKMRVVVFLLLCFFSKSVFCFNFCTIQPRLAHL